MNDIHSGIPMYNDTDNKTLGMNNLLTSKEEVGKPGISILGEMKTFFRNMEIR